MFAKFISKNQVVLPKGVLSSCRGTRYFYVEQENRSIVLTPTRRRRPAGHARATRLKPPLFQDEQSPVEAIRAKLAAIGITQQDVADAVRWARRGAPVHERFPRKRGRSWVSQRLIRPKKVP